MFRIAGRQRQCVNAATPLMKITLLSLASIEEMIVLSGGGP
jgi:hypothetical protein